MNNVHSCSLRVVAVLFLAQAVQVSKLTIQGVILCFFLFDFYANVQRNVTWGIYYITCQRSAKRDTGHILYYLTIELDHAKRDSRLAADGGVWSEFIL